MKTLSEWLEDAGLHKYRDVLLANAVDIDIVHELSDDDLREFGIPLGDRRRFLRAAAQRSAGQDYQPERRHLTVMFCDLVGSTARSTRLDAERVRDLLRAYQDTCFAVVRRYDGTVSRAYGDGLLIYFGYPVAHDDDAGRAVLAALDIIDAVHQMRVPGTADGEDRLQVRVGVHSGQVVVGGLRPHDWLDPMGVTGDTPNIAARMQELAPPDTVVVSPATRRLAGNVAMFESLGHTAVKGLDAPLELFTASRRAAHGGLEPESSHLPYTPLVGRDHDLARLLEAWRDFHSGGTRAALLCGAPGIGKTRLALAFANTVRDEGAVVLQLRGASVHAHSPFHPLVELLERAMLGLHADPTAPRLRVLEDFVEHLGLERGKAVPLLAPVLSIALGDEYARPDLPPDRRMSETMDTVVACLAALGAGAPTVVMFEDLHWMDPSTLAVIARIVDASPTGGLFVLGTFRPEFVPAWAAAPTVASATLGQLTDADARAIVLRAAPGANLSDDVVDHIVARTDGVPLFLEELTKLIVEAQAGGELPQDLTTERLAVTSIPETLHDSLLARLDRHGEAKAVARLGATIGREFSMRMLLALSEQDEATVRRHLARLEAAELILARPGTRGEWYAFKHALVQGAAYSTLLLRDRQALHKRIAGLIAQEATQSGVPQPQLLAHHCTEAGDLAAGVAHWLEAGERAVERYAIPEAISQLNTGLRLLKELPESPERIALELKYHIAIAMPVASAKGYTAPELVATLERARELCQRLGNPRQIFPVLHGMGKFYQAQAEHGKVDSLGQELLDIARRADDDALYVEAHRNLGMSYALAGRYTESVAHCDAALARYVPEKHRVHTLIYAVDPAVVALSFVSWSLWALGRIDEGEARIARAVAYAAEIEHPYSEAFALSSAATFHQLRRDPRQALAYAQRAMELSVARSFPYWQGWSAVPLGWALCELGQVSEGLTTIERGLAGYARAGVIAGRPGRLCQLAEATARAGDVPAALALVEEVLLLPELPADLYHGEAHRLHGDLLIALGAEPATARQSYVRALAVARASRAATFELRTLVSLARLPAPWDEQARALASVRALYASFTQGLATVDLVAARALLEVAH